ncbi:hypothetical protein PVAND_001892 [Polypedilum vanderplanki]|uniref:E3 ubiquitin-protein ligase MARCHF5 n=1 Tax=Polypedilum vanderplanki TaxID=319348 RepID=A0A9J6BPS2_POLVA|nr:hypothetical protein PVAND_001892 [Polypedilum vanderplanki]
MDNLNDSFDGNISAINEEIDKILSISLAEVQQQQPQQNSRYCWVCFATEEDEEEGNDKLTWVKPCNCKGTLKWVHQTCLLRWIDEKQKGNSFKKVSCQQCQTEYIIVLPQMGLVSDLLEGLDNVIRRSSPFLAAGVFVGSFYWASVTYGAITILQVVGHDEGLRILEDTDHIFLMVALPAIPVCLVLGRMIRWEDAILRFIQNRSRKNFRMLGIILPIPEDDGENNQADNNQISRNISDTLSTTRVLCGALLLPSISNIVGRIFFSNIKNNLHRTLLGGLAFVVAKGMLKIYFKQKQFIRKKQRKIVDYTDENIQRYMQNRIIHEP